ncbi:hypothetical protein ABZP36_004590 [Zizania latifolia]
MAATATMTWHEELATLVGDTGVRLPRAGGEAVANVAAVGSGWYGVEEGEGMAEEGWAQQTRGFVESTAEMLRVACMLGVLFATFLIEWQDKTLLEGPMFNAFWEKDVAESVRQGDARPFVEEAVLQVSDWDFSLSDIQMQKKEDLSLFELIKSLFSQAEREWVGFLGPIHIWQGMDDRMVPPSVTEYIRRVVPGATVHKLLDEGHFSYFCFCDECHRQIFSTLFGIPQGPINPIPESIEVASELTVETTVPDKVK